MRMTESQLFNVTHKGAPRFINCKITKYHVHLLKPHCPLISCCVHGVLCENVMLAHDQIGAAMDPPCSGHEALGFIYPDGLIWKLIISPNFYVMIVSFSENNLLSESAIFIKC